ncbi:hypothetical protein AVEN_22971-1 [Araneus ventricosus]|uniref:Tc3 transposase DNA binding domain-containing protein n=1 Tax=Araneus ventricosus TaxID=182803 RepID=A0A4Y2RPY5_ARAVE|nr:hypothetical protein AVEN_22971-1 [Araneus ventricosus]
MGPAFHPSKEEIGQVLILKSESFLRRKIARKINRSPKVINNLLQDVHQYGRRKGKTALTTITKERRLIFLHPSNSCLRTRRIAEENGIKASI